MAGVAGFEHKLNKEKAISFEDLVKKMGLENEI